MLLKNNKVTKVIDTRINNTSQLSWFAKQPDFEFFLSLFEVEYKYEPMFAPTKELLEQYRKKKINRIQYETIFKDIIEKRKIQSIFNVKDLDNACLLCSEHSSDKCHRRLLVEYLSHKNPWEIQVMHLL